MGVRYVFTTGNDSADGLTPASAWKTWQHAVNNVVFGDIIEVEAGVYGENVVLNVDGAVGFPITIRKYAAIAGDVVLDGTGGQRTLSMESRLYWNFEDFSIVNDGGTPTDTFLYGIFIGSQVPGAPNAQGCAELHFTRIHVTRVNRNARTDCLSVPVSILSYGDETAGGTASRNITWDFCVFDDCDGERRDHVIGTGFFAVAGNVKDIAWRDCIFNNVGHTSFISGIDTGGNILPGSKPDRPRKLVFIRNTVSDIVGEGFYNQACHDVLVADNVFIRNGFGVGANTEPQVSADYDILRRFWARDNLFIDTTFTDMNAGAWIPAYDDVSDVYYSNNTIWREASSPNVYPILLLGGDQTVPGKFGIIGSSRFTNNIVIAPSELMSSTLPAGSTMQLNNNLWGSDSATPFIWLSGAPTAFPYAVNQDQFGHFQSYNTVTFEGPLGDSNGYRLAPSSWANDRGGGRTPNWYITGLFGVYDPLVETDIYGNIINTPIIDVGASQLMSKPILTETARVGAPSASYDIKRVTTDPRTGGLAADLGTIVEYISSQGIISLQKYTTWNTGWRPFGGGPLYPKSTAEFLAATKLTPSALYLMDTILPTADLFDATGNGNTLAVNGTTPTVQKTIEGKVGTWFDALADGYVSDRNDPGVNSFVWGGEVTIINDPGPGFNGLGGRRSATAEGFYFFTQPAGTINYNVKDAAGLTAAAGFPGAPNLATNPRVPYLISGQVDKSAAPNHVRGRISRNGALIASFDVTPGTFGTFTFAGQFYIVGGNVAFGTLLGGAWISYHYFASGVQCEGANVLRDLHVGLGWEI